MKSEQQAIPLRQYLDAWGGRLPYEAAVRLLTPVIRQTASLHAAGQSHLGISPESVFVSLADNTGALAGPSGAPDTGFSAPELFERPEGAGSWSDVYSLCALIYFIVTGRQPPSVSERAAAGGMLDLGELGLDNNTQAMLGAGLAYSAYQRPRDAFDLAVKLGVSLAAPAPVPSPAPSPLSAPRTKAPKEPRPAGKKRKWVVLIAVFLPLFLLLTGAAGFYFYTDGKYNAAVSCISSHDYKTAIADLTQVIRSYKESDQYMQYATGCEGLAKGDLSTARKYLTKLGSFADSKKMLKEVDYQQALQDMKNSRLDDAKAAFTKLGDYKDSATMIRECDYQKAARMLSSGDCEGARSLFLSLGNYKDSVSMQDECDYQRAKQLLGAKDFQAAKALFTSLAGRKYKDSDQMVTECDYQSALKAFGEQSWLSAYKAFTALQSYKDSADYAGKAADSAYSDAVGKYRSGDYSGCQTILTALGGNYHDSSRYFTLCDAHHATGIGDRSLFNQLTALTQINFEDAEKLRESDPFIRYRMEGKWQDKNKYYYIELKSTDNWTFNYWLPADISGDKYRIGDCIVYFGTTSNMQPTYKLTFEGENQLSVYCYGNGTTLNLTR